MQTNKLSIYAAIETPLLPDLQGEEVGYNSLEVALQTQAATILGYCEAQGKEPADFLREAFLIFSVWATARESSMEPTCITIPILPLL